MIDLMAPLERTRLTEDLLSGEPKRVLTALEALDHAWRHRCFGPLPLPPPSCLEAFGDSVPVETLELYLSVVENYPDFEPTPSGSERRHAMVEAVIRHGRGEGTYNVALALKVDELPEYAVSDALGYIGNSEIEGPHEMLAVERLVDQLLDSEKTRRATVDMLRLWAMMDRFPEVLDAVRPRLDDAERARLQVDNE